MAQEQVVTFSFFKYQGFKYKWWALRQMQRSRQALSQIPSLLFYKLMGSGSGNGFGLWPDFSVYAVLGVWPSLQEAKSALRNQAVFLNMQARASHQLTVYMQSTKCRGTWNGQQPFDGKAAQDDDEPIAVITRASINPKKIISFWKRVPAVSRRLSQVEGTAFYKGVGEMPLLEQATFSIWQSQQHMINYAYKGKKHREIIKKTHALKWYTEELFSEFKIVNIEQDWPELDIKLLRRQKVPVQDL